MDLEVLLTQKGWFLTFGTVFLWGLAMNVTPCVYPMIPITVSYFGGMGSGRPARTFLMALLFVIGLAITYSVLGVTAAMTGRLFGATLANPWVVGFVSLVMVAMGLSLLGLFQMTVSSGILSRIQEIRDRAGWLGALFFGLVAGIVMAPCVGPFIVSLLAFVATRQDPVMGFWMFFTLAFGMGLPYLVLGTFAGAVKAMPRPGSWMLWLERFFGLVLIGFALWLWMPFVPAPWKIVVPAVYVALAGLWLGFREASGNERAGFKAFKRALGVVAVLLAAWLALPLMASPPPPGNATIQWQAWSPELLAKAKAEGRPVIIDFYADWCAACKELDHKTWSDPKVAEAAQRFLAVKVDLTKDADHLDAVPSAKPYDLVGLPTVIFLGPDGKEIKDLRLEDFTPPDRMIARLAEVP